MRRLTANQCPRSTMKVIVDDVPARGGELQR